MSGGNWLDRRDGQSDGRIVQVKAGGSKQRQDGPNKGKTVQAKGGMVQK